jgi:gliding motility-associated-like protein
MIKLLVAKRYQNTAMFFRLRSWYLLLLFLTISFTCKCQWQEMNNGLFGGQVIELIYTEEILYAGTFGGVFASTDEGETWTALREGLGQLSVNSFAVCQGYLFCAINESTGLYALEAGNQRWVRSSTGLGEFAVISLAATPTHVFALNNQGNLFVSSNLGITWESIGFMTGNVTRISSFGARLFATTFEGIFESSDNGQTWVARNNGLTSTYCYGSDEIEGTFITWTKDGIFLSTDAAVTWKKTNVGIGYPTVVKKGSIIIAGNFVNAFISSNDGASFTSLPALRGITCAMVINNKIIVGNDYGLHKSYDNGNSWVSINEGMTNARINTFAESGNSWFVGTGLSVYRSDNHGNLWTKQSLSPELQLVHGLASAGSNIVAAAESGLYVSENNGATWEKASSERAGSFITVDDALIAVNAGRLVISKDNGRSWTIHSEQSGLARLVYDGTTLYGAHYSGIMSSKDKGKTWIVLPGSGSLPNYLHTLFFNDGQIFAGVVNAGVYTSADQGATWVSSNNGMATNQIQCFASANNNVYASGYREVLESSNNGTNWTSITDGLINLEGSNDVRSMTFHHNSLFVGTYGTGIWRWNPSAPCVPPPAPSITAHSENGITTFESNATAGNQWYYNGQAIQGATDRLLFPADGGSYTVVVSVGGCSSSSTEQTFSPVELYPEIEMMNVFTPDGDDKNPLFMPRRYRDIVSSSMTIYDRWGRPVHSTTELLRGWNGGEHPSAVYYYIVQFTDALNRRGELKGSVQLLRP